MGGTSFMQFNLEIGRSFGRILRLVAFIDAGNVYVVSINLILESCVAVLALVYAY